MPFNPTGFAKVNTEVIDQSVVLSTQPRGITAVIGLTERGKTQTPTLVGSWVEFQRLFGGLVDDVSLFPLYCKRALEGGAKLIVNRIAHYTDLTDQTTITGVQATFTVTSGLNNATFKGNGVGEGYNGIIVLVAAAASGDTTKWDITITIPGYPNFTEYVKDFPKQPTATEIAQFNSNSRVVVLYSYTGTIPSGTYTLASGTYDDTSVDAQDYIGDQTGKTGIYAMDSVTEAFYAAVPDKADPDIDTALLAYVDTRKDMIALLRTPIGVNDTGAIDYRMGTGSYTHQAFDTFRGILSTGGIKIKHPVSGIITEISEIGDVIAGRATKASKYGEWTTLGGAIRGKFKTALSTVYNFYTVPAQFDAIDNKGIDAVIGHPTNGVVYWGNNSLQRADTLLKYGNVAELMVYLTRSLKPLMESVLFEPNNPDTWKNLYNMVKTFMNDLASKEAFYGAENVGWRYEGDQGVDDVVDCVVNTPEDIQAGIYRVNIFVKPTVAIKYVSLQFIVTNIGVNLEEVSV